MVEIWKRGAIILDVRSPEEFSSGHASGAVNIPLPQIDSRVQEIKSWKQPVIACCASGRRSGLATQRLKVDGIEIYNGGSWKSVSELIKNHTHHE